MNNLPKYVEKDLSVLYNAEFKVSKYGYSYTDYFRMAVKLFKMASKYPEKYLEAVLEYLGYFTSCDEQLNEADYRAEIFHNAEEYFISAMEDNFMCYDENVNKQVEFIEMGFIDCWYSSKKNFKASNYQRKYPSKLVTAY